MDDGFLLNGGFLLVEDWDQDQGLVEDRSIGVFSISCKRGEAVV